MKRTPSPTSPPVLRSSINGVPQNFIPGYTKSHSIPGTPESQRKPSTYNRRGSLNAFYERALVTAGFKALLPSASREHINKIEGQISQRARHPSVVRLKQDYERPRSMSSNLHYSEITDQTYPVPRKISKMTDVDPLIQRKWRSMDNILHDPSPPATTQTPNTEVSQTPTDGVKFRPERARTYNNRRSMIITTV